MVDLPLNKIKQQSLKKYCKDYKIGYGGFITEDTFDISKYSDFKYIEKLISGGSLIIDEVNLNKLKRYYA